MEKRRRWQFYLILAVVVLTVYNILPTLFFYSKPLKKPISEREARGVSSKILERVNGLEDFTVAWLKAQSKNLGLKPQSVALDHDNPRLAHVSFKEAKDASMFAHSLTRSGALIPFVPAELSLDPRSLGSAQTTVTVQRRIGVHLDPEAQNALFLYIPKWSAQGEVSEGYRQIVNDRATKITAALAGESDAARQLATLVPQKSDHNNGETALRLARTVVESDNAFGDNSAAAKRYFASFTQIDATPAVKNQMVETLLATFENRTERLSEEIAQAKEKESALAKEEKFLTEDQMQRLHIAQSQKELFEAAALIVKRNASLFAGGSTPLTDGQIAKLLQESYKSGEATQVINITGLNPFVDALVMDWKRETIELHLYNDVAALRGSVAGTEEKAHEIEKLNQLLYNEIAQKARRSDETITPTLNYFTIALTDLTSSSGMLAFDLSLIAKDQLATMKALLTDSWKGGGDLSSENYPLYDFETFSKLPKEKQRLSLVFYAPLNDASKEEGFRNSSLYIIAKDMGIIAQKYRDLPSGPEKESFEKSFRVLQETLRQNGFIGYLGSQSTLPKSYQNDFIFELDDFSAYLLAATREKFLVKGSKKLALLEFTDVEQRLLTLNKIESTEQEELLRWQDEYKAARANLDPVLKYSIPPPIRSPFWNNLWLSTKKYFRGDDRKILKWGLDLSGGKTVRIALKDPDNRIISNEDDVRQAMSELYQRVNRLGVSEVGIRQEGENIVLDFPGSQGLSASELVKASAMYFHVVNEKFSPSNTALAEAVNTFLEEVWNEAVITNHKESEGIEKIAWEHLGGDAAHPGEFHPLTSHAKLLYDHGLRLSHEGSAPRSSTFDDTLSSVTLFRGEDFTKWQGQTHPLVIIFRNYALEGAELADVQVGYDAQEGNVLSFRVKGSYTKGGEKINPRDNFYEWTSQFSEEKIAGTPKEGYSQGKGWRMAVILNGSVISAPTLNAALRDSARITGHFTQREVNELAADLKAGSLSFTPTILSEENISPDVGKEQRTQGIFAALLGVTLVIIAMCTYYRFGGVVASVAVLFNLFIIWAVLQNIGAALTLPGIAGIILNFGMSVDANVLVFERIREEFAISKRLPLAIQAGYRKAFSAIIDSNITTIIAALILLNFDSGPIKGFALTLIIGIISSMFTALFMTRYFFAGWVQNPAHKELKMMRLFKETSIAFLSKAKMAFIASAALIVIGLYLLVAGHKTILGMDFTGGYALKAEFVEKKGVNYRVQATEALIAAGALASEVQIRELSRPTALRIQIGMSIEQSGRPFSQLAASSADTTLFAYEQNPRIVWVVQALQNAGLELTEESRSHLELNWSEMSGQLSDTMRNQALLGLLLALLAILVYVSFRFEFTYALSATLGLAHDLLITLGLLALFHIFDNRIQIDLQVIAAFMTIIGYSLNDTIIIFDRIREDLHLQRRRSFVEIVNHALNATLSRTVMTSGTTFLVLLALLFFGGAAIFNFALIMTIGVAVGTLSSLFIAAPLLVFFHERRRSSIESKSGI